MNGRGVVGTPLGSVVLAQSAILTGSLFLGCNMLFDIEQGVYTEAPGIDELTTESPPPESTSKAPDPTTEAPAGSVAPAEPVVPASTSALTSAPTTTSASTGTGTVSSGTTTVPPAVKPLSTCTNTNYESENVANNRAEFPGASSIFVYGDDTTSACLDDRATPGTVCLEGNAVDALEDYSHWGAGFGVQLGEAPGSGPSIPWDAQGLGITSVRFILSNVQGRPVRVQITQTDDPAITDALSNYERNGFVLGGSAPQSAPAGTNTIALGDFLLPNWSAEKVGPALGLSKTALNDEPLDASKMFTLQFQANSDIGDDREKYTFCVSDIEWLDAAGDVVEVAPR